MRTLPPLSPSLRLSCAALLPLLAAASCRSNPPAQADASLGQTVTVTSARPPESPTLKARMHEHDKHGAAVRDAVARGDLDTAKREAAILAGLRIEGTIEPSWQKQLGAMNEAAAEVAGAANLAEASRDLAALARTCGSCHATLGGPAPIVGEPPGQGSGVGLHMQRHQWAAASLWDGLVVPSDDAWRAGARVLADAPLSPEVLVPGKSPVPAIGQLATSVHQLGQKAKVVKAGVDRGAIYGELVATCAACHSRLGGGPTTPSKP